MRKTITSVFICLTLVLTTVSFSTALNTNKIIYVDDDGGADYTSIQDAIDAASDGDTVFVYNGVYRETVSIDKSIHLIGEDKYETIINGTDISSFSMLSITSPSVEIEGFSLLDGDWTIYGDDYDEVQVLSIHAKDCTIKDNVIITNTRYGIKVNPDSNNTHILNNYVTALVAGIQLDSSSHNIIMNNQVVGGKGQHKDNGVQLDGIRAEHSDYNNFTLNHIAGNGYGVALYHCNFNQFSNNNFINGGNTKTFGKITITIFSSNVYSYLINKNYWDGNYYDNYLGILPFHSVTDHFIPWTVEDYLNIDWNPATEPYEIGGETI